MLAFSPYSRGWSPSDRVGTTNQLIFPVFAGMVPARHGDITIDRNFPRIRGDGPELMEVMGIKSKFSPYSRGWSADTMDGGDILKIFPVFAGMIPAEIALRSVLMVILLHYDPD